MRKTALVPTSEKAIRLAAIMHRKPTTPWSEKKEIPNFRKLLPHIADDDLALVERYYRMNWPPISNHNNLRHDLATLINNWSGEVDRARIWSERHPPKIVRKIIDFPIETPVPAKSAEQEEAERLHRSELMAQLRAQIKGAR